MLYYMLYLKKIYCMYFFYCFVLEVKMVLKMLNPIVYLNHRIYFIILFILLVYFCITLHYNMCIINGILPRFVLCSNNLSFWLCDNLKFLLVAKTILGKG